MLARTGAEMDILVAVFPHEHLVFVHGTDRYAM